MKRRKKKRTSGSRLIALAVLLLTPSIFADKKKTGDAYGLIAVSVFKEPGFALPGAEVTLAPHVDPGGAPAKGKKLKDFTDARGELVFRVPSTAMRYDVHASSKGYVPQEKTVAIEGEEHLEVTFLLSSESK